MCYHAEIGRSALNGVGIKSGEPPKLGSAGTLRSWDGRRGWPIIHATLPCYPVRFATSVTKGVRINRREPQNWGALGPCPLRVGAWLTPKNTPFPTCYPAESGRSRLNGTSVIKDIRLKIWPLASCHSRSIEVIGTDTDRSATYDFLLMFHSKRGPISYRFRDKRRCQSKIAFFPLRVFNAPDEGVPLELGTGARG